MDQDDDSAEEIETIHRTLAPLTPSSSGINTQNNNTINNNMASNQENSMPIHPLLFLLLNSSLMQQPDEPKDIQKPLDYLKQLKEPIQQIIEDERAIQSLIEINEIFRKNKEKINFIIESKLQMLLKEIIQFEYECLRDYVEKGEFNIEVENTSPKFTTFHLICDLTEILVVTSKEFAALFHMIGGTKSFLSFFANHNLMKFMTKSLTKSDPFRNERKMNYNKALGSILNSLLYLKNNRTQSFKELNAIEILTLFCNSLNFENCELILRSHFILSVLSARKQIERLENLDFTILILEKTIQMFAQACQKKTKYNSYQFDLFYDNDVRSFEISSNNSPNTFIIIVLSVMEAFLVNDDVRFRVFGTIKNSLLILLIQGDLIEKYFALCLLINFAFDDVLNEKIRQISNLPAIIEQLLAQSHQMDESVLALIHCLKSLLDIKKIVNTYKTSLVVPNNKPQLVSDSLILISFNEVNELAAMKIRNELEKLNYKVKLLERKSQLQKFDIDAIIKSIGECQVMMVCVSSSYEYDKISQFEADLAMKLDKLILPVNVQNKYMPDYWLEVVVESKTIVPFNLTTVRSDIMAIAKEINLKLSGGRSKTMLHLGQFVSRSKSMSETAQIGNGKSKTCILL